MLNKKLRVVIRHEFLTVVRQPSFWIALIAFPVLLGVIILIGALTDSSDKPQLDNIQDYRISVIDNSNLINSQIIQQYGLDLENDRSRQELEESVKGGHLDGLIIYPENLKETGKYELLADNTEENNSATVSEIGRLVLQQSLLEPIESDVLAALALSGGEGSMTAYKEGQPERSFSQVIVPGAFLVLFYLVLIFSVGYALTTVSEEKENRSIEMVLSYVKPQTLIVGKLFAIILLTLTQIAFFALMAGATYLVARSLGNELTLPFSLSDITFVPSEILIGISFLIFGFIFFVGLMAMIGAIFPSSKEANGFSTIFYLMPALPFWGFDAIANQPDSTFTQILTYFPLSSPTTVLLRNAVGNIDLFEGLISLVILIVSTLIIIALATKAFRLGTLEYTDRIKLSLLFKK